MDDLRAADAAKPNYKGAYGMVTDQPWEIDRFQAGRPSERLRLLLVVQIDEVQKRPLEILNGIMDAALAPYQLPEEALDGIHPEAEGPSAMLFQPVHDGLVLVDCIVIQNQTQVKSDSVSLSITSRRNARNSRCRWHLAHLPVII